MQDRDVSGAPRIRLLGPLEVLDGGVTVRVRSPLQRLLLTMLVLEANRTLPADRLIDELWGDQLPSDPAGALRTQVSRLRRGLPPFAVIVTEARGYRLVVDADDIDTWRFGQLLAVAAEHSGDDALRLVDDALALWRGRPLDELVDRPFALIEQRRLDQLHESARERRIALLLAAGRAAEAAVDAEALVADRPEGERARALLMEALYRSGRATQALDVYEAWRRELDERGLEPSPVLRDLETRILRHDIDVDVDTDVATPTHEPIPARRLPRPVSRFIGRDTDLLGVADLLTAARLVTLWGAGGVGKTRLAVEVAGVVADRYPDGVHLCDLTVLTAGSDVARAIANSVGLHERSGRRLEVQLADWLGERRLLLILDNCEHVLEAAASVAQLVVQSTAGVDVLATSRERLGVDGEHLWELAPLDVNGPGSPAVQLFVDRARATHPSFAASTEDLEVIVDVCRRLDGLPLAVELGAARLRGLSPSELLEALDTRPEVLRGGVGKPARHRSLRAVIEWSYSLLTPVEQRVFDRLAVFRGAFGLDAARAVVSDDDLSADEVELALFRLLDQALLVEWAEAPRRRYSMLDTVRRYGTERLQAEGSMDEAARRHATWLLAQTERASRGLGGPAEAAAATVIEGSLDEVRAAHRWLVGHDLDRSLRLVAALRPYALWRGQSEVFRWAEVTAAAAAGTDSPLLPEALLAAATGAWQRGDLATARSTADAIARAGHPAETRQAALEASADVALLSGELDRARAEFTDAHVLALAAGDRLQAVWDIGSAAVAAGYAGDTQGATPLAAEASTIAEQCGSPSARAFAHFAFGEILAAEHPDAAASHLYRATELSTVADTRFVTGLAEVALAALHGRNHDVGSALTHCRSALLRWHRAGAWTPFWVTMRVVIAVLSQVGSLEDAATLLAAAQTARSGAPPFGVDAVTMRDTADRLRAALGDHAFERCLERGRSMTEDDALQLAVEALERAATTVAVS